MEPDICAKKSSTKCLVGESFTMILLQSQIYDKLKKNFFFCCWGEKVQRGEMEKKRWKQNKDGGRRNKKERKKRVEEIKSGIGQSSMEC